MRKGLIWGALLLTVLAAGCGRQGAAGGKAPAGTEAAGVQSGSGAETAATDAGAEIDEDTGTDTGTERGADMTEEQKALLKQISVSSDNIEEGVLYEWQKEVLNQYDFAMDYLRRKYPSHEFQIVDCAQKNKVNPYTTFWFDADGSEESYEMYVEVKDGEEDRYQATDTFFGSLVQEEYGEAVEEYLRPRLPECLGCKAWISAALGEEYGEAKTAEELFEENGRVDNLTEIYLDGSRGGQAEALADKAEKAIRDRNLYGAYEVYVLSELPAQSTDRDAVAAFVKEKRDEGIFCRTFQCFE